MSKIGRNDPCPCGSKKKYKHCCWKKGITYSSQSQKNHEKTAFVVRDYFKKFHTIDLTATLAALTLDPRNHGKNLRLDYLTLEALASNEESEEAIEPNNLKKILGTHFPFYVMEDPPVNLFTENAISPIGNKIVFGGNFEQGVFTLNEFIKVTNYYRESIPEKLINNLVSAQHLLLFISDLIANSIGHQRNLSGEFDTSSDIVFPDNLEEYKSALWFDRSLLTEYCKKYNLNLEVLKHFVIGHLDVKSSTIDIGNIGGNPLLVKPILEFPEGFLVVSPTNIVAALVHFTLVQVNRFKCMKEFIHAFHGLVWKELIFYLRHLGFDRIQYEFPENTNIPVKSALFKFDENKYALLTFTYDSGNSYNLLTPCHSDPDSHGLDTREYSKSSVKQIKETFTNCELLQMNVYSSIGREYTLLGAYEKGEHGFVTSAFKFLSLLKSDHQDKMTLWYFERAQEKFSELVDIFPMSSFLDRFSFYKSRDSFYIDDKALPTDFAIAPGEEFAIIEKAVLNEDPIVVYYHDDKFSHPVLLPVIKADEYILRYASKENDMAHLEFMIPGFPFSLWVRSGKKSKDMKTKEYIPYWELNRTICYWLTEVRNELHEHIQSLSIIVLTLVYDFESFHFFEDLSLLGTKDPAAVNSFNLTVSDEKIHILIPKNLDTYFSAPDNEGERILLSKIIEAFGLLLEENGMKNTLDHETKQAIVDKVAPMGLKKMFLLLDSEKDLAADPRYLVDVRYMQEANRQLFMDEVVPGLGKKCPPIGDILEKEKKFELTKNIVLGVLLPKLNEILSEYNSLELLKKILALNDSLLHENALKEIRTPTRIQCFRNQEDVVEKIVNQSKLADETTLSVRCLIEHLAASPTFGTKTISTQTIDDLIALMSLIIFWGGVGDQIKHDLFDVHIKVLPSGRIGTNSHEITDEFFDQLSTMRAKEYIEETTDNFSSKFVNNKVKKSVPEGLDEAFSEEVGISIPKLGGIMEVFTLIGFDQAIPVPSLSLEELKLEIHENFDKSITVEEVNAALTFLCLKDRGGVQNLPEEGGFENNDIHPWRYNRRLSYLQRPLILVDYGPEKDDPKIYWTPRHVNLSWKFIVNLFFTGRFKAPIKSKLESKIGKISQHRRVKLQREAFDWFKSQSSGIVEPEVGIGPKQRLKNKKLIGDIDILVIDFEMKVILSVECKRTEPARNSKEMIEEVNKYFDSPKGYFKKHIRRHEWLKRNRELISKEFETDVSEFSIHSIFVTNEALTLQFMQDRTTPMPIVSMYELRNKTISELISMISTY